MTTALYVLLGLSALIDLALGAWAGVSWSSYVRTWHLTGCLEGDPRLLGLVLGLALAFFAVLQGVALRWIRMEKEEGHWIAISFGFYLIVSSLITFMAFRQRPEFLLVDGVRGALLVVLSAVVLRSPSTLRRLQLPDGLQDATARERGYPESGREGGRRPDRGRGRGEGRRGSRSESSRVRSSRRPGERRDASRRRGQDGQERTRSQRGEMDGLVEGEQTDVANKVWSRRYEARPRTAEELISEPFRVKRPPTDDSLDHPLTVVVKGVPDSLRVQSYGDEDGLALELPESPDMGREAHGGPPERRRRRRRPRSRSAGTSDRTDGEDSA